MLITHFMLSLLMLLVFASDLTRYTIPNWLNGVILALYPVFLFITPEAVDWLGALYALGVVFAVGFALFAFNVMGGGDIKLLCALSVWCGWGKVLAMFVVYTSLLGGLLAVLVYVARFLVIAWASRQEREIRLPRLLTYGEPLPYGLAIAGAFLGLLWAGKLPGLPVPVDYFFSS